MTGDRLEVGRIVKAHGIRGEVIVEAVSNRRERFTAGSVLSFRMSVMSHAAC